MDGIPVVYVDWMMALVAADELQQLIDEDVIIKFQRNDGWVYPGIDPVRKRNHISYNGPERRDLS